MYVSCAGGVRAECDIPVVYEDAADWVADGAIDVQNGSVCFEAKISGLAGGHSGVEIHKQHTNAIRLLASLLSHASGAADFRLVSLSGGGKENAIPKEAKAVVSVRSCDATTLNKASKRVRLCGCRKSARQSHMLRLSLKRQTLQQTRFLIPRALQM